MKTIKLFLTTIALLLCSVMANAYDFEVDGMYYNLLSATDLTVEVTWGDNAYSGEVVIPSTITYQSRNLAVVGISSSAFYNDSALTSITIPQSIVSIYDDSFVNCKSLKHLYIENYDGHEYFNTKDIAILVINRRNKSPFCDCPLESIYIGRGFTYRTTTHAPLFYQQTQLKSLTIGESFREIENDMFNGCTSLEEVYIEDHYGRLDLGYNDESQYIGVFSDCPIKYLYLGRDLKYPIDRNKNVCVNFLGQKRNSVATLRSLTIGKFVNNIEDCAFCYCDSLQKLRIEDGNKTLKVSIRSFLESNYCYFVDSIDLYLGRNLDYSQGIEKKSPFESIKFKSVVLGDSITSIADGMFYQCYSLKNITIPSNIIYIGNEAFYRTPLSEITLPNSVTNMGDRVFEDCWWLENITLPNGLTSIGEAVFDDCSSLESIAIPDGVTSIGNSAFADCPLKNLSIPDSVINIGDYAFAGCAFASITIPNSVSTLGTGAFSGCDSLTSIYMEKATPITLNRDILSASDYINTTLYVPSGSLGAYQVANIWRNFWTIQEYVLDKKFCVNYYIDGEFYAVDSVKHCDTIILREEPIKEGYKFSGWSEAPETMPAHDVEIYGNFIFSSVTDVKVDSEQSQKVLENNQLFIIRPDGKKYNTIGQEL